MSGLGPRTATTYNSAIPTNYVAGVGRGAQGFTTRSDIGPARNTAAMPTTIGNEVQFGQAPAGYVAGGGRGMGMLARDQGELNVKQTTEEQDRGDYSESNFNEFGGYSENLFKDTVYEDDDHEADRIYEAIDERMESRRKRRRELEMLSELNKNKNDRPKIADQFADLKRELAFVSADQWESIPEVGDHSLKLKQKQRKDTYAPVPDFIISGLQQRSEYNSTDSNVPGDASTVGTQSVIGLAEARGTILSLKANFHI